MAFSAFKSVLLNSGSLSYMQAQAVNLLPPAPQNRSGITFRDIFSHVFGCNFIFYPFNHKNKVLFNGILPDHYIVTFLTESPTGKYMFLALWNHINFDTNFVLLLNNYKTL